MKSLVVADTRDEFCSSDFCQLSKKLLEGQQGIRNAAVASKGKEEGRGRPFEEKSGQ